MQLEVLSSSLLVSLMWSISPIVKKYILRTLPVETLMVVSASIHYIAILVFILVFKREQFNSGIKYVDFGVVGPLLATILIALAANYIYLNLLQQNDSYLVTSLTNLSPIFITIIAIIFLKEKVTIKAGLGVVLICMGVVLLLERHP